MKVLEAHRPEAIEEAARLIREGGVVVFPTETVYGLGADAFNPLSVARVFEIKRRPRFDPLIVHIAEPGQLALLALEWNKRAERLMERFWPGPLTLVLKKRPEVPEIVTAGLETVAIRMPSHPVALSLIRKAQRPIAAPSANPFGRLSPTRVEHLSEEILEGADLVLDAGPCPIGVESTILALVGEPVLLRPGGIPVEEIEEVIGPVVRNKVLLRPMAPGGLPQHYSPRTPLRVITDDLRVEEGIKVGLLAFKSPREGPFKMVEVLSPRGDLKEAASRFFEALHRLDKAGLDLILAEPVPEEGLGLAIMDRLRKAEGRWNA